MNKQEFRAKLDDADFLKDSIADLWENKKECESECVPNEDIEGPALNLVSEGFSDPYKKESEPKKKRRKANKKK